ncbi:MAG TPA: radical SAM protein [Rhodospirillales bacterium]
MRAFDELWVWDDPAVAARLGWYRAVAANRRPAKLKIARAVPARVPLDAPEDALWAELERLTPEFLEQWRDVRDGGGSPRPAGGANLLGLCRALARRMLGHCNFCRWDCGVDRLRGTKFGTCKLDSGSRVSTFFHHPGEELVYRGRLGSGTIFFTSCNMRCAFCQNGDISTDKDNGMAVDARTLAAMAWLLRREGCHNINWVGGDPTIHLHAIADAIAILGEPGYRPARVDLVRALGAKADPFVLPGADDDLGDGDFNAPMLWNSNFIMSAETMKILRLLMDVWLPDFKFGPGRCALELSRTPFYWDAVTTNLKLVESWGEDLTIRHLVMPGHVECCTVPVLDWIAEHMPSAPVNIMDQYHPDTFTDPRSPQFRERYRPLARRPSADEIRAAYEYGRRRRLKFEAVTFEKARSGAHAGFFPD